MRAGARSSSRAVPAVDFCASSAATTSRCIRSEEPREAKPSTRETTQIYLHVMKKPGVGVRSPLDGLA